MTIHGRRSITLIVALFLLCGVLFGSGIGLHLVKGGARLLSGGRMVIGKAEGVLLGHFILEDIRIDTAGAVYKIDTFEWDWSPLRLLAGELDIAGIDVAGVVVGLRDNGPEVQAAKGGPVVLPRLLLPLKISLKRLAVSSLQLQNSHGRELLVFDTFDLAMRGKGNSLTIDNISLQGPELGMAIHGTVDFDRNWRVDLLGNWRVINYGFHQVEGTLSATGPLNSPHAAVGIHRPVDIRVEGDVVNLLEKPEWTATLEGRNVDLEAFIKHCPKIDLATVHGQVHGNTEGYWGQVQALGTWGTLDNMQVQTTISAGLMGIDFDTLRIDRGDAWAVADNAKIDWKRLFDWQGLFHFKNFDPSHFFDFLPGKIDADLTSVGTVRDDLGVDVTFEVARLEGTLHDRPISAAGTVTLNENDIRTEGMIVRSGEMEGSARIEKGMISWADRVSWSWDIHLNNFDPSGLHPDFPGQVNGVLAGEGFLGTSGAEGFLRISDISGQLRGNSLVGNGEISLTKDTIQTTGLFLRSGASQLLVQGQAGNAFALDLTFSSPDIGTLLPEAGGSVELLATLRGSLQEPRVEAKLHGEKLVFGEVSYGRLQANLSSQLSDNSRLQGSFAADALSLAGLQLEHGRLDFSGSLKEQEVTGQAAGTFGKVQFRAQAGGEDEWRGAVKDFILSSSPIGTWQQKDNAALLIAGNKMFLEKFCIAQGASSFCAGGDLLVEEDLGWQFTSQFTSIPLEIINNINLLNAPVNGRLDGQITASGVNRRLLSTQVEVRLPETDLQLGDNDQDANFIHCQDTILKLNLSDSLLHANLVTQMNNGSRLSLMADTQGTEIFIAPLRSLPLSGNLDLQNFDLAILSSFTGFGVEPTGRVNSSFVLGGTIGRPELAGEGEIEGGGITLPYQGITLENVKVAIKATEDGARVVGQATSGPGSISADGRLYYGDTGLEGDLHVSSYDFLLVNLPEYAIRVNSDVQMRLAKNRGAIRGTVLVPYALITPEEMKDSVSVSKDVVLVNGRQESKELGWPFSLDLEVLLGRDVHIDGYGLTGKLGGQLRVKTATGEFPTAKGELDLSEGVFTIYSRTLDIERGRILFTGGPIDNPGIDVRAQKKFSDKEALNRGYTVGVDISGLMQDLSYNLFSDPYMDDTEILSQMIVGHSLAFSNKEEGSLLQAAANTLGLKGGADLFQGLGDILQLDDMHIEGSSRKENVSLVVGKKLTKDLYVGYDMNMFSQLGQFRVRYDLARGFAVETRSSSQSTGADLLYTFEK
ncbi:MAG: translocation/assembly module TamB domain-containing protein [Desulforhopalus sp.]|nr:translocation/assembly module TamB domain-containing protein [Desulforhopalus sp.]